MESANVVVGETRTSKYFSDAEDGIIISLASKQIEATSLRKKTEPESKPEGKDNAESKDELTEPKTPSLDLMVLDIIKHFEEQSASKSL